ncbi:MAG: Gfo/Idh/MocA family oxidoreductase [Candidatus Hydrogenedentes bacterium]|nr:Gfo/Idh/MocA family oxidoreductase [Candidatus Hydrogenedentota bacterium]
MQSAAGATVMAAGGVNASAQPDQAVRLGIAGAGSRGCDLLRALATIQLARVVAVCDDYPPHLAQGSEAAGQNPRAFDTFEAMLDTTQLDALVVATPLHLHYPMCAAAIERGLPVFCEKTMCRTIEEARRLAVLVKTHGAIFQVGLQRRSNAIYEQAEAMIQTGLLGTITAIKCQWHRNGDWRRPVPVNVDHADYKMLEHKLNWRLYFAYSQGLMAELGSHQMDVVNRLLRVPPKGVIGMGGVDYWKDGREVFDNVFCTYTYEVPDAGEGKPQVVRVTYSTIQTNAHEGVSELVMGTKGSLLLSQKLGLFYSESNKAPVVAAPPTDKKFDGISGATLVVPDSPWAHRGKAMEIRSEADDTRAELLSFVNDVRAGNRKTVCDVHVGLENTATIVIANEAIESGAMVKFPEDCAAN